MQVLLVGAFPVRVSGHCYDSQEIHRFSESFRVANITKAGFSKLKTRALLRFCFITQRTLSLPDSPRKIERPLLGGYKLTNNNFFKDRSLQRYLVLDILTNPVRVTLTKKVTFGEKPTTNFTVYRLLFED